MKFLISIALCGCMLFALNAQNRPDRQRGTDTPGMMAHDKDVSEKIQVERIAFFSEKIGLTADEAQLFWPIYNEMDQKKTELFEKRAGIIRRFRTESNKLSSKEIDNMLNELVSIQQQEAELPNLYHKQFRNILSAEKVMNVYMAEIEFRGYLLQKMRNRRDPDNHQNDTK